MRYSLAFLFVIAVLASSCAATRPTGPSHINPNLTPEQREDIINLTMVINASDLNVTANLDDFDGNGLLDLIYIGPALKNPVENLGVIAQYSAMYLKLASYAIDKIVVHAGTNTWIAEFAVVTTCAELEIGDTKEGCSVEDMWQKSE